MIRPLIISSMLLLAACTPPTGNDGKSEAHSADSWTPPRAGTLVAADSTKVTEDLLNDAWFSVRLSVSEGNTGRPTEGFKYDVHARYGKAEAEGLIIMPFGGERLQPLLRRGEGYSYIMGFIPGPELGGDTSFHEYYRIDGYKDYIKISPLKGFVVQ